MAKFKAAAVFSSSMVLQREKNIRVFGQGVDGRIVSVTFDNKIYSAKVKNQKWEIMLPPMSAGDDYVMTLTDGFDTFTFDRIAIGEVWLAGGQSNMEYELQNCTGGEDMLCNDENPGVRYYYTNKLAYLDANFYELEEKSGWTEFSEENARNWSAVAYIFAKKLAKELKVTVGVIGCNWGGTSAACWMSEGSLAEDSELTVYLQDYQKATRGKTEEEQLKEYREYEAYHKEWDKKCSELYLKNPDISWDEVQEILGICRWPGPVNCANFYRPNGLYHCMLQRIMPYTLRGFIYYQGEEDAKRAEIYQKLLTRMIRQWREDWEDHTLPFLLVQLPMHRYKHEPDNKSWCLIREAQMRTYQTLKNTGIAVTLDCGEFHEIHPKDKKPVGERLALQALYQVYQKINDKQAFGPIYRDYVYKDGRIELHFDYAEDGFVIRGKAEGFEIAGEDLDYKKAEVVINDNKISIYSESITHPIYARYCWTNYSEVTVFGKNGIPLAPFRTVFGR